MDVALRAASQALGRTAPNPAVGVVIVRDGRLLSEGHTQPPGQDHAEVAALRAVGGKAEGATVYVTLEPCCHWGRTPPCTDALIRAGVARVVVGTIDPFPLVAGQGIRKLREAGIEVTVGVRREECRRMMLGFLRATLVGLPAVTLKAATTLDGRIASESGESRWITGEEARKEAHLLRDRHDAVLVGVGTVLADDPELTTRLPSGKDARPVVLDTHLRTPLSSKILRRNPLVFCGPDAKDPLPGAECVRIPLREGRVDSEEALRELARRGYHRVMVEGGAQVHRSILPFADSLSLFINGRILAGGPSFVGGPGFSLTGAPSFQFASAKTVGKDLALSLERPLSEVLPASYLVEE